ncbi:MAG TPA: hypothetical protein IAC31_05560 [Candidatus Faecousia intestinigallinarum]|nr:hypothetical protein [Candidatus Faecousia intestinigallinarum]
MDDQVLCFFGEHLPALPLYEAFFQRLQATMEMFTVRVQKTQISFYNQRFFAAVSFLPVRKAAQRPKDFITVTFGLGYRVEHPRIDAAAEPYPCRWTHHVLVSRAEEIDDTLMGWVQEAAAFSAAKR